MRLTSIKFRTTLRRMIFNGEETWMLQHAVVEGYTHADLLLVKGFEPKEGDIYEVTIRRRIKK